MGFTPVFFEFFGLPLDVRHVTLNTGMFAFAAARFGPSAFRQVWLYSAMVGIAIMFVLNLGVSFAIASFVALTRLRCGPQRARIDSALCAQANDFVTVAISLSRAAQDGGRRRPGGGYRASGARCVVLPQFTLSEAPA